jgi:LPS export ABC transporter protein LptC
MRSLLITLTAILLAACGNQATTPSARETQILPADQIITGLRHTMSTNGIRRALLLGDTAYMQQSSSRIDLVGVMMTFYDEQGREAGTLTSRTGQFDARAKTMVAEGDAVLTTQGEEGTRILETEQLHFDVDGDRLWSTVPVVMKENGRELRGTSFESDGQFQNVTVQNPESSDHPVGGSDGGIRF